MAFRANFRIADEPFKADIGRTQSKRPHGLTQHPCSVPISGTRTRKAARRQSALVQPSLPRTALMPAQCSKPGRPVVAHPDRICSVQRPAPVCARGKRRQHEALQGLLSYSNLTRITSCVGKSYRKAVKTARQVRRYHQIHLSNSDGPGHHPEKGRDDCASAEGRAYRTGRDGVRIRSRWCTRRYRGSYGSDPNQVGTDVAPGLRPV